MGKLPLPLLALAMLFVACGGDARSDKEEEIVAAIDYALVSTAPDACTEASTQALHEQLFRHAGPGAVKSCEQNARAEESPNDPVEVTDVEVDGSRATAEIGLTDDGDATGQVFAAALVEEGGSWKLDELTGFAEFDQRRWVEEQKESLEAPYNAVEPRVVDCIVEAYREMSQAEIEEMVLGGSAQPELEIGESCERG
ncbi:MAG: hypothetical protein M3Y75_08190 [Actinomycetota bacterium]|nr:hypothetical protein [Actinomycetota bacterium]